jgi:hypothetical protein
MSDDSPKPPKTASELRAAIEKERENYETIDLECDKCLLKLNEMPFVEGYVDADSEYERLRARLSAELSDLKRRRTACAIRVKELSLESRKVAAVDGKKRRTRSRDEGVVKRVALALANRGLRAPEHVDLYDREGVPLPAKYAQYRTWANALKKDPKGIRSLLWKDLNPKSDLSLH